MATASNPLSERSSAGAGRLYPAQKSNGQKAERQSLHRKRTRGNSSVEYADNRISLYAAQYGKCAVTGRTLAPHEIHCHHKRPKSAGGTDAYANLTIVSETVHRLVHATDEKTISRLLQTLSLDTQQRKKLNKLREQANLNAI